MGGTVAPRGRLRWEAVLKHATGLRLVPLSPMRSTIQASSRRSGSSAA